MNWIITSKYGDCINAIPIIYHEFQTTDSIQTVITSEKYGDIFSGCSYVRGVDAPCKWGDVFSVIKWAKERYEEVKILQCHGDRFPFEQTQRSFQQEVYLRAGLLDQWDKLELIFDNRDEKREQELISKTVPRAKLRGRPFEKFILLGDAGESAPFPQIEELYSMLQSSFGETHKIIRLSSVRAHKIYDLIGLYDRAACLVTIDTVHLHLAKASKVPIVALARDGWVGASPSKHFKLYANYSQWDKLKEKIIGTVGALINL